MTVYVESQVYSVKFRSTRRTIRRVFLHTLVELFKLCPAVFDKEFTTVSVGVGDHGIVQQQIAQITTVALLNLRSKPTRKF